MQLRVLTQCLKCLATFCTYSWDVRDLIFKSEILILSVRVAENVIIDKNTFNDATRLGFYVKSILRLACNMVTEAPQDLDESDDI